MMLYRLILPGKQVSNAEITMQQVQLNGMYQRWSMAEGKLRCVVQKIYGRKFEEISGSSGNRLQELELGFSGLLMVFLQFYHLVHILAAGLVAFAFFFGSAATAGLFVMIAHPDINQLSLAKMQVYRGACGAAQVEKGQYEHQELFHSEQK